MDPNSSAWAYAYNRIVPTATGSSDDFQHPHLASISAAAGTSAQSLLLQAAHSSIAGFNATSGNFVPPGPIGGYNPVFQQIYHHAAQAAVQPKPAHYASSTVNTPHRQIGLSGAVEKLENCRPQPASISYSSNHAINLPTSSYYGDNSSSSGASPSPTTSATSSTTLSWNTPVVGGSQQMTANSFLTMNQHQQQDIHRGEKVTNSKQANLHTKTHSKSYGDLIFVGNHEEQHEQVTLQLDNRTIHAVSEDYCNRPEEGFYTFVDGKLTYNISAAAISSVTSLSNRLSASSVRVVTPKKQSSGDGRQPAQQQSLSQIPSPAYPIYESPSLCSSVGSPPPTVKSSQDNEGGNDSSHIIVYKSNTPAQQAQTSIDISTVGRGANSNNNRSTNYVRNGLNNNSLLPATGVAYSSVITNALQVNQQLQLHQRHDNSQHPDCWLGNGTDKLSDPNKHNQKCYSVQSPNVQENNVYLFPSSLQIKHTTQEPVLQNAESSQSTSDLQQQMINSALHIMSPQTTLEKRLSHQQMQPQINRDSKHHSAEHVLNTNNTVASQIQSTTKIEEVHKPTPPKKTPRKRQPKKTLLTNNEYPRTSQQNNTQLRQQPITLNQVTQQQQQTVQLQHQNGSFYDYNNRWVSQKIDTNTDTSVFANTQQHQQTNIIPQPAHVQSNQTHPHISQISQYYPAFPQQVSTQYAACMSQNTNHYNLTPLSHDASQDQPPQQQGTQQSQSSLQQNSSSAETKNQETTESSIYKVIVPNIEDELHFLLSTDQKSSAVSAQPQNNFFYGRDVNQQKSDLQNQSKSDTSNLFHASMGKKSGFMDSYLKFLQGERDESPPPIVKSGRKFNYQKPLMQTDSVNSNKRKSNDTSQLTTTQSVADCKSFSPVVETSAEPAANHDGLANDAHKIKIISQTQILPKKRPQAQNMAAAIQQTTASPQGIVQDHQSTQQLPQNINSQFRQNHQQSFHQDPLALPPRREQSLRKAKSRSINEIMQSTPLPTDRDEPEEFADSDADPVWTPQEDDSDDARSGKLSCKRKIHRNKAAMSTKKKDVSTSKGIENEDAKQMLPVSTTTKSISEVTSTSGHLTSTDNFKTGDFIVLRSDLVNDWPIIWQVDSKCILQKYEPFCQNGKMFYRNMSKYASWNLDTKKLYLKAPVRIQIQSHTETIVEFMRSELLADDTEQFIEKIMEDYLTYRDHFEIYIQTMISQVLDPSFFSEINREKDEYFLSSVRTIDEIMENCKRKLLSITPWTRSVIVSIETWPQCHVFTEWGQNNVNQKNCGGCHQPGISVRFLLFGHPYDTHTMQTIPVDMRVAYEKDILLCRICAARADIFHKIAHEKYNLFAICTRRVGEHQKEFPVKGSTEILNDLLAENNWVDELFRNMRSSWAEVESLERQKRFHEVSQ